MDRLSRRSTSPKDKYQDWRPMFYRTRHYEDVCLLYSTQIAGLLVWQQKEGITNIDLLFSQMFFVVLEFLCSLHLPLLNSARKKMLLCNVRAQQRLIHLGSTRPSSFQGPILMHATFLSVACSDLLASNDMCSLFVRPG